MTPGHSSSRPICSPGRRYHPDIIRHGSTIGGKHAQMLEINPDLLLIAGNMDTGNKYTWEWKLVQHADGGGELYHLAEDPREWVNRYDDPDCREIRAELTEEMVHHLLRHPRGRFNAGSNRFFG